MGSGLGATGFAAGAAAGTATAIEDLSADVHNRIHWLCRVPVTLGKGQFALGKLFAECNTLQTLTWRASF